MELTLIGREPRVFDGPRLPADATVLAELTAQVADADLAAPPVVLPDFHHKSTMELPSSVAVATAGTIRPTLTSASVNCGMALLALDCERPGVAGVIEFYRRVRERYPYPARNLRELSTHEVRRAAVEGSYFAAERFEVDAGELARVEEFGRLDLDRYGGADRLARELPSLAYQLARLRFGTVGPSNHFVELQVVEEVFDPRAAELLGVRQGQLTLQYHAGGGVLTGEIGALFGRRKHYPRHLRMAMAVQKPLYHLATARSYRQLRERLALYFTDGCPPVSRDSEEGQRLMLANAAAMNYGFAFRTATYAALKKIAATVFGGTGGRLVVDSPHNSIYEEEVGDRTAVVHRHNSCRAFPAERCAPGTVFAETGQAVLLPGTSRTSSYLAVAGPKAEASLHSACHGAGTLVADFAEKGLSAEHPDGHETLRFGYDGAAAVRVRHFDDNGVNAALGVLVDHGLVRPVARLRPLAVLN
ncbi:RtcB family protein [Dactylosporangium fulvum]|uniref:tRNA-splicing ligase RtcB n=1 Tax=Dactylosporangium fulvum TaxID=53359 RepID=A0ABY5W7I3_9ACTN|nr:RtcB family protein [Dactylosporangium fulvum]UWP85497.1 RtcB family protein [Dactylosporangium fulvum]